MSNLQKYLNKVNSNVDREIEKFVLKYIKKAWFPEALETNLDMFGSEFEKNFYEDNKKKIDLEYFIDTSYA